MATPKRNKSALGNGGGRPTSYKPEFAELARNYCLLGAVDKDLAVFFEVAIDTIHEWKKVQPEFSDALKVGKAEADAQVAARLYERALGFEHDDVDIRVVGGKIVKTKIRKYFPPDTTACIFWLKNRDKAHWRDKTENEVTTPGIDELILAARRKRAAERS